MTAQIGDRYKYRGWEYTIVAQSDSLDIHPTLFGIVPKAATSACWSGFWCVYDIRKDGIYLKDLYVCSKDDLYPTINGKKPATCADGSEWSYMGHHLYCNLNYRVPYTGRLLVGRGFLSKYYIHMGYQKPWSYRKLKELIFEEGVLVEVIDQSRVAAQLRRKIKKENLYRVGFIDGCVSLDETDLWWL